MLTRISILIAFIVVAFSVAGVQADSIEERVDCRALAEADCQILRDNVQVMDGVHSVHFDMQLDLGVSLGGLMDLLQVNGAGGGKLAVDPAAAEAAAAGDSEDGSDTWIALLATAMTGEISLHLTGETPEDEIDTLFMVLMENGVFVLNEGAMATLGGRMITGVEWIGYDARGAVDELNAEVGAGDSAEDGGDRSPEMEEANDNAMSLKRLPDSEVMGVPVAVIETAVDMNSVMALMTMEDVLAEAEDDEVQYADLMLALLQNTDVRDLSWRQYIGLDDHYTHRADVTIDIAVDGESLGMEGFDIEVAVAIVIDLSAFNEPVEVELPEDVMLIPLEMLLGMGL